MTISRRAWPWLTLEQAADLPLGSALTVDLRNRREHVRGRLDAVLRRVDETPSAIYLAVPATDPQRVLWAAEVARARVMPSVFEEGDAVLLREVSASDWRGGVVRTEARRVRVETIGGFEWVAEEDLVLADTLARPPALPRGPVPGRAETALTKAGAG